MFDDKTNIMFDLYGTLVDIKTDEGLPYLWSSMASIYSLKGASYNDTDLRLEYGRLCEAETNKLLRSKLNKKHKLTASDVEIDLLEVFKALYEQKGVKPSKQELSDAAVAFRSISTVKLQLYPGAAEILKGLKSRGKKLYLLSNAQACFTVPELKSLGIYDLFDGITISSDAKVKKPSLAFYEKALGDIDPSSCVMIGNDEFADIRGAMGAGMDACYIQTEQSPSFPRNLPSDSIRELRELLD
ncbi:MAG: HAD family hydrolase [Clostridiales bacterium]|nr:HAD family hydrolase [Clostridiales bacterium]